jgi:ABC-2 type transport system ATP-binding protein
MMDRLVVTGICNRYGSVTILDNVNLSVRRGEVVALTGENGAGKSTFLRICAGMLAPDAGCVQADGTIGYCPQAIGLFDLLTADDHLVMFGRGVGFGRAEAQVWRDAGKAVVVVTHMLAELERVDRVVELPAHPSRAHERHHR